jgi:hypothetical protein
MIKVEEFKNVFIDKNGYFYYEKKGEFFKKALSIRGRFYTFMANQKRYYCRRIVAKYLVPNPKDLEFVWAKDGNGLNHHPDNLTWVSLDTLNLKAKITLVKYNTETKPAKQKARCLDFETAAKIAKDDLARDFYCGKISEEEIKQTITNLILSKVVYWGDIVYDVSATCFLFVLDRLKRGLCRSLNGTIAFSVKRERQNLINEVTTNSNDWHFETAECSFSF